MGRRALRFGALAVAATVALTAVIVVSRGRPPTQDVRLSGGDTPAVGEATPDGLVVAGPPLSTPPAPTPNLPRVPRVPRLPAVTVPRVVATLVPALPTCDAGTARAFPDRSTYAISTKGGALKRVLSPDGGVASVVSFSPDGARIAFTRYDPATGARSLRMARADGSNEASVPTSVANPGNVEWSPDGSYLAYLSDPAEPAAQSRSVVLHRLSDGHVSRVWTGEGVQFVFWSRQSDRLAWGTVRDADRGVWVADVVTGATRRILDDATYSEVSWSPDGRLLAVGGSERVTLVRSDNGEVVLPLTVGGRPRWSPVDQDTLLVAGAPVYAVNTLTGVPRPLGPGHVYEWLPDGRGYLGDDGANLGVYRFESACFTALARGWGFSAGFDGLSPDGATALLRVRPTY